MTDQPTNVIAALARVTAELGGIEKLSPQERAKRGLGGGDERGVSYAYRGIDQIAAAAAPLFGKYGVVVVPNVLHREVKDLTINGKPWTDTALDVEWTVYGPGGTDDRVVSVTCGLGRDNSDKGPNKALTQSYKNLLLRLLCIGDPADDVDGHTHEADARQERREPNPKAEPLIDRMAVLPEDVQNTLLGWFKVPPADWHTLDDGPLDKLAEQISKAEKKVEASTAPSGAQGGEGDSNPPEDLPAPPAAPAGEDNTTTPGGAAAITKPATKSPAAAARAALNGEKPKDKPALGGVRVPKDDADQVEMLSDALGAEVVS